VRRSRITLSRKLKSLFVRLRLHYLTGPLDKILLQASYLSQWSRWCAKHAPTTLHVADPDARHALYEFLLDTEQLDEAITYLEFGVAQGNSFRWWVEHNHHPDSRFVGFDTFTGLPEPWGPFAQGAFSTEGQVPKIEDARCRFVVGMFQQTLATNMPDEEYRLVVHLDADLYSSTLFVLTTLAPQLTKGDILIFDEFGVPLHEFRAFCDFASAYQVKYTVLAATDNYLHVAIKLV